ncbi:hypothetical protein CVT25_013308, partial [Psilocybe cyanescens]
IWRCYHIWGQSFWAISVKLIHLVAEFGLVITSTVFEVLTGQTTSNANVKISNNIARAVDFSTYRLSVKWSNIQKIIQPFVALVIESAAAYSLVLLLEAIIVIVPSFTELESPLEEADSYLQPVLVAVEGMAPTVLVARIALTNPNNTDASAPITHISGLQFGSHQGSGRSRNAIGGEINASIHTDDAESTSMGELKESLAWMPHVWTIMSKFGIIRGNQAQIR